MTISLEGIYYIWLIKKTKMTKLFALTGKIQNYAWGGRQYISELLGKDQKGQKVAEYWLGAHVNSPSIVTTDDGEIALNTFLDLNLNQTLGAAIAKKFGRLPFLFKVLDVNNMLSIQVHPSKLEAEKGFKIENEKGIPLDAPFRNYKDDNHKPEIMVALSDFWLLHGFLAKEKMTERLNYIPEFKGLLNVFEKDGYLGLYKKVMEQSQEESEKILSPLINRILPIYKAGGLDKSNPDYWAARSCELSEDKNALDKGVFSIYFFNIVKAKKGEAIFQDAGIPHSYLEGQNIELMANSDNVLRAGLTQKHVDVPELLKHVVFEETQPHLMSGKLQKDGIETIYKSQAPDFELSKIELQKTQKYLTKAKTAQILIIIEGEATIREGKTSLKRKKGDSVLLTAEADYGISTASKLILYKATAP
jgi:mannose-6-phosphate isomerase